MFSDIGKSFAGERLLYAEYLRWEKAYIAAAGQFFTASGLRNLRIKGLEKNRLPYVTARQLKGIAFDPQEFVKRRVVGPDLLDDTCRLLLREVVWCKLEINDTFYLHFGWDYYMYIGSVVPSRSAIAATRKAGLFVEAMPSPYL